ncbi:hypothetical protein ABT127_05070 [Streptomyces sp. NPDC001904]|uniref:hypothetical protein n=1 Tax=Streptomyces sp. NPDC001904 TaxID=3154531 RepID=UPI00331F6DA2
MRASRFLLGTATLVLLGSAASATAATAVKPPPAASFVSTRTAVVVTELGAQEITVGATSTLTVTGRLVEGETLTYPLARLALAVEVTGGPKDAARRCNTVTSDEGRFSCTFHTGAHQMSSAAVRFAGNALFAPAEATTSIADHPSASPSPVASATPSAVTPAAPSAAPTTPATPTVPATPTATSPTPVPAAPTSPAPTSPAAAPAPTQSQTPAPGTTPAALPATSPSGASMP